MMVESSAFGAFTLSVIGGGLALLYARRAGLFDIPNHRSSHSVPTPRGGGIALVLSVLLVTAYELTRNETRSRWQFVLLLTVTLALVWVGWLDDRRSTRVGLRLCVHIACGLAVALLLADTAPLPGLLNLGWLAWWVFWTVASINIVNFMDGIDGLVASQGVVYGAYLYFLLSEVTVGRAFGLILAAACLGFLVWNWSPAKMFMGDVGSGPLGLYFVIGGMLAVGHARISLIFLPLFPLFLDALVTIFIRFRRGEKLTDPHRAHLYQRLANGGYGHARVSLIYAVAATSGGVIALSVRNAPVTYVKGAVMIYLAFVVLGWKVLHHNFVDVTVPAQPPSVGLEQ
jgi:Fuc2NAc and GlcNAc transferase